MDVSDESLGEWDIVSSASLESLDEKIEDKEDAPVVKEDAPEVKEDTPEVKEDEPEVKEDEPEVTEDATEDILGDAREDEEEEKEDIPEDNMACNRSEVIRDEELVHGSHIEDMEPEYPPHYEGSCSSGSDIDVIDESSLEDGHSHTSLYPSLDLSMSSSTLETTINRRPIVATTPEVGSPPPVRPVRIEVPAPPLFPRLQATAYIFMVLFILLFMFKIEPKGLHNAFSDMENRIMQLEAENKELKDHMLSKVDDDKLLVTMEKQISALKDENHKLSVFMQDLIHELEHQTIVFKKDSEAKGETSHQNEIDKLKEQVNILRIDNDELQKQLVRMRYGVYSPRPTDASDTSEKKESMAEINEQENATEILSEEIKDLREKLLSEVAKLNEWKKSVHVLMKGLENPPVELSDATKSKGQKNKKGNRYDNILKDINDQFAEAVNNIPHFNLSDLVHKYMGVDKKKVKSVFDSVGHFFKKAQEKTKDIFDENIKSDMWNFIGSFRKQWHVLRKSYFEYSKKLQQEYNPRKEHASRSNGKRVEETYHNTERNDQKYERNIHKVEEMAEKNTDIPSSYDQQDFVYEPRGQQEAQRERRGEATISRNSWVFERAAHRSENRENQNEEEEEVNWFLRNKKKTTENPDYFSMDENDHETDSYEPNDMFSMD